jgi:thiol-disulfide isomerase/thioredoxin
MGTSLKTVILMVAAGALALAAGFATHNLLAPAGMRGQLLSDDADVESLFATRLPDVRGNETPFADVAGKVTVVNFWATWCTPCREEIPDFVKLQEEYRDRGVRFVGIAAEKADKVPAFVREMGINYPILIGEFAAIELSRKLGDKSGALPFTVVIDANRRLVHRELGVFKPAKIREIFSKLL